MEMANTRSAGQNVSACAAWYVVLLGRSQLTPGYVCHQLSYYLSSMQLNRGVGAYSCCSSHKACGRRVGRLTRLHLRTGVLLRALLALDHRFEALLRGGNQKLPTL